MLLVHGADQLADVVDAEYAGVLLGLKDRQAADDGSVDHNASTPSSPVRSVVHPSMPMLSSSASWQRCRTGGSSYIGVDLDQPPRVLAQVSHGDCGLAVHMVRSQLTGRLRPLRPRHHRSNAVHRTNRGPGGVPSHTPEMIAALGANDGTHVTAGGPSSAARSI